jgi:hypothetical protein
MSTFLKASISLFSWASAITVASDRCSATLQTAQYAACIDHPADVWQDQRQHRRRGSPSNFIPGIGNWPFAGATI